MGHSKKKTKSTNSTLMAALGLGYLGDLDQSVCTQIERSIKEAALMAILRGTGLIELMSKYDPETHISFWAAFNDTVKEVFGISLSEAIEDFHAPEIKNHMMVYLGRNLHNFNESSEDFGNRINAVVTVLTETFRPEHPKLRQKSGSGLTKLASSESSNFKSSRAFTVAESMIDARKQTETETNTNTEITSVSGSSSGWTSPESPPVLGGTPAQLQYYGISNNNNVGVGQMYGVPNWKPNGVPYFQGTMTPGQLMPNVYSSHPNNNGNFGGGVNVNFNSNPIVRDDSAITNPDSPTAGVQDPSPLNLEANETADEIEVNSDTKGKKKSFAAIVGGASSDNKKSRRKRRRNKEPSKRNQSSNKTTSTDKSGSGTNIEIGMEHAESLALLIAKCLNTPVTPKNYKPNCQHSGEDHDGKNCFALHDNLNYDVYSRDNQPGDPLETVSEEDLAKLALSTYNNLEEISHPISSVESLMKHFVAYQDEFESSLCFESKDMSAGNLGPVFICCYIVIRFLWRYNNINSFYSVPSYKDNLLPELYTKTLDDIENLVECSGKELAEAYIDTENGATYRNPYIAWVLSYYALNCMMPNPTIDTVKYEFFMESGNRNSNLEGIVLDTYYPMLDDVHIAALREFFYNFGVVEDMETANLLVQNPEIDPSDIEIVESSYQTVEVDRLDATEETMPSPIDKFDDFDLFDPKNRKSSSSWADDC